jgi:hypothetical protein
MNIAVCALLGVYVFGSGSDQSPKNEESLKKRVLSEYPKALKELEGFYGKARGSVQVREEYLGDPKKPIVRTWAYSFVSNGPEMARVRMGSTDNSSGSRQSAERVICYNKDYSFVLSKGIESNNYSIKSLDKGKAAVSREMQAKLSLYLDAPFHMFLHSLGSLVAQPRFRVISVASTVHGGMPMLGIEFDCPIDNNLQGGYEGKIIVSPGEKWVLHQYEYKFKKGVGFRTGTVEYEGTFQGFPVPKRVVHGTMELPEHRQVTVTTFDFKNFRFDTSPAKEFTLAAFGLPELMQVGEVRRTISAGYWLIVLALVALSIAIVLKVASTRLKKPGLE